MSGAKVALGRRLFFEPRLSVTGQYSCATCHQPSRAFTDGRKRRLGALGDPTPTNAMSLTSVAYNVSFGWSTSSVRTLEDQMRQPLTSLPEPPKPSLRASSVLASAQVEHVRR